MVTNIDFLRFQYELKQEYMKTGSEVIQVDRDKVTHTKEYVEWLEKRLMNQPQQVIIKL